MYFVIVRAVSVELWQKNSGAGKKWQNKGKLWHRYSTGQVNSIGLIGNIDKMKFTKDIWETVPKRSFLINLKKILILMK